MQKQPQNHNKTDTLQIYQTPKLHCTADHISSKKALTRQQKQNVHSHVKYIKLTYNEYI